MKENGIWRCGRCPCLSDWEKSIDSREDIMLRALVRHDADPDGGGLPAEFCGEPEPRIYRGTVDALEAPPFVPEERGLEVHCEQSVPSAPEVLDLPPILLSLSCWHLRNLEVS